MKDWKQLIGNEKAEKIFKFLLNVQQGGKKATQLEKNYVNNLANILNKEGYDDDCICKYLDWMELQNNFHKKVK